MRKKGPMSALIFRFLAFSALSAATIAGFGTVYADPDAVPTVVQVSQFSGKPVPRFESLRYSAVHGRQGPSLDHPILWRYEKQGLPMLIVRETHGWRRVRDKDGDEVWMQARMLSTDRTVIIIQDQTLFKRPDPASQGRATLKAGLVAQLEKCEQGWCSVKIGRQSGWVTKAALWGVETATGGL